MNQVTNQLPPVLTLHYLYTHPTPLPFPLIKMDAPHSAKPLAPERFTHGIIGSAKAVYEFIKRVLTVVYRFFESLISGSRLPQNKMEGPKDFFVIPSSVKDPKVVLQLSIALKAALPSKVKYSDDQEPVEFGTFIFEHLLEKGRGGVEFDSESGIYSVMFPEAKRVPITFNEDVKKRLNGRVVDPVLRHAQVVQFKLGEGKMELLGDSLTASAKIQAGLLGEFTVDTTVQGLVGTAAVPFAETHMLADIRLNEGTNSAIRGLINNVICPLMHTDLSQVKVRREPGVRLLHSILHPKK